MATGGAANLALGGGDPRNSLYSDDKLGNIGAEGITAYTRPQLRAIRDPNVSFEEYQYYAEKCRAEEDASAALEPKVGILGVIFPTKSSQGIGLDGPRRDSTAIGMPESHRDIAADETKDASAKTTGVVDITSEEWINAQRAMRNASGAACFYLITTDILGPYGLAYSFGTVGWAPGVVLFTLFAILAGYSGYLINKMFMGTDSYQYPTRAYGDVAYRIYGQWARIPINFLQSTQLILTVSLITITNGQALSVITKFNLCYVVCVVILVVVGMAVGQIRTLQKVGWLANCAVFINVFIIIFTMVMAATQKPNYAAATFLGAGGSTNSTLVTPLNKAKTKFLPVSHYTNIPDSPLGFVGALNGIMNTVFAYGGANIFNEFMAEMKRPRDFLRAMWAAQFFIWFVYMFYGLFMYGYQGQYSVNPSPQTITPYWALVISNVLYIIGAGIAACLYGNIGLKVIYNNIFVELFRFPPLTARWGKILWAILIPIYWAVAFVIGASIPNFAYLVGVVGAICIVQFTYSLPPFFHIGYMIQRNAKLPGEGFDPATGAVTRHDKGFKRFWRGLTGGSKWEKAMMAWNIIYFPAALALGGLGAYASIKLIIGSFTEGGANAFSCASPLNFEKAQ